MHARNHVVAAAEEKLESEDKDKSNMPLSMYISMIIGNHSNNQPSNIHPPVTSSISNKRTTTSYFGFSSPLTLSWFISVVGSEYCQTYLWIAKDLSWMQGSRHPSIFFGLLALLWSMLLLYHGIRTENWHEIWNFTAHFLWLFANFWWMKGETHDYEYPDEIPIATDNANTSAVVLLIALCWLLLYYTVFLPFNLLYTRKSSLFEYDDGSLKAPTSKCFAFKSFRRYENLHMVFWIAKDLAWNRLNLYMWAFFLLPTLYIAADFIYIAATSYAEDYTVDVTHYIVTLFWVIGNSVWAFGDFFIEEYDEPFFIWTLSEESLMTARWYSAWILFVDMIPVFLMYGIWATLTLVGKLKANAMVNVNAIIQENDEVLHRQAWGVSTTDLQLLSITERDSLLSSVVDISSSSGSEMVGKSTTTSGGGFVTQRIRGFAVNEGNSPDNVSYHDSLSDHSSSSSLLDKKASPM